MIKRAKSSFSLFIFVVMVSFYRQNVQFDSWNLNGFSSPRWNLHFQVSTTDCKIHGISIRSNRHYNNPQINIEDRCPATTSSIGVQSPGRICCGLNLIIRRVVEPLIQRWITRFHIDQFRMISYFFFIKPIIFRSK